MKTLRKEEHADTDIMVIHVHEIMKQPFGLSTWFKDRL